MADAVRELQTCCMLLSFTLLAVSGEWAVHLPTDPVCAMVGSSVVLPCSYNYPRHPPHDGGEKGGKGGGEQPSYNVSSEMWCLEQSRCITPRYVYHSEQIFPEPAYVGRVEYLGEPGSRSCSLRISDLRASDSGTYVFYFITSHPVEKLPAQTGVQLLVSEEDLDCKQNRDTVEFQESVIGRRIWIMGLTLAVILVVLVTVACIRWKMRSQSGSRQQAYMLTGISQTP